MFLEYLGGQIVDGVEKAVLALAGAEEALNEVGDRVESACQLVNNVVDHFKILSSS